MPLLPLTLEEVDADPSLMIHLVRMGLSPRLMYRNLSEYRPCELPFPPRVQYVLPRLILCLRRDSIGRSSRGEILDAVVHAPLGVLSSAHVVPFLHPC